jgi:hypothetical protein
MLLVTWGLLLSHAFDKMTAQSPVSAIEAKRVALGGELEKQICISSCPFDQLHDLSLRVPLANSAIPPQMSPKDDFQKGHTNSCDGTWDRCIGLIQGESIEHDGSSCASRSHASQLNQWGPSDASSSLSSSNSLSGA